MLVTTIPAALDAGARLLTRCRAWRLNLTAGEVSGLECQALDSAGLCANGVRITVRARHYVLAGGAINTRRSCCAAACRMPLAGWASTFCIPTVLSAALFAERVDAWHGAPQTVYSDHFCTQRSTARWATSWKPARAPAAGLGDADRPGRKPRRADAANAAPACDAGAIARWFSCG